MPEFDLRRSGAWYVAVLLTAPVLYTVVNTVVGPEATIGSMPAPLVAFYLAGLIGVVLWVMFRPTEPWDGWTRGWLMLVVVMWLYATVMWSLQGEQIAGGSILLPVTLLLILLKRPSVQDVWRAADAFGWVVASSVALVLLLEVTGAIPSWYEVQGDVGRDLLPFDLANYWLPLRDLLGLEGRWGGYAGFPNIQGQAGALLMVFGFMRGGIRRAAFVGTGAAVLLLTDSRTSYAAGAVGLILLALMPGWRHGARTWPASRVLALLLGVIMGLRVALKVIADPNLTGRIAVWPDFLSLSSQNPVLGAGKTAIDGAVDDGVLPGWADQGHNILIDTLVRFGALGLALAIAILGLALAIGVRGARLGLGLSVALTSALITSCMGDLGLVWPYPTEGMSALILGVMLARRPADQPDEPVPQIAATALPPAA